MAKSLPVMRPTPAATGGTLLVVLALGLLTQGCQLRSGPSPTLVVQTLSQADAGSVDLDHVNTDGRVMLVLVIDSSENKSDAQWLAAAGPRVFPLLIDVANSRNRAMAMRFHLTATPLLVCLTPSGVIAHRDEADITAELVRKRAAETIAEAPALDAKLAALRQAVAANPQDDNAQLMLADFLTAQKNARQAIAPLGAVAHREAAGPALRIRAWVDLARAHLWIGEPEKGRHEAADLMKTLGGHWPEALAGGKLVMGQQDAAAKRTEQARREFEEAIAAAPASTDAAQARQALTTLPGALK